MGIPQNSRGAHRVAHRIVGAAIPTILKGPYYSKAIAIQVRQAFNIICRNPVVSVVACPSFICLYHPLGASQIQIGPPLPSIEHYHPQRKGRKGPPPRFQGKEPTIIRDILRSCLKFYGPQVVNTYIIRLSLSVESYQQHKEMPDSFQDLDAVGPPTILKVSHAII